MTIGTKKITAQEQLDRDIKQYIYINVTVIKVLATLGVVVIGGTLLLTNPHIVALLLN